MGRAWRIVLATVAVFAAMFILIVASVLVAGRSASGRLLLERLTRQVTGGSVQVGGLGEGLPSHLTLASLSLRDRRGVWLTATGISVRWRPWALLERKVLIDEAHAASVAVARAPLAAATTAATPPRIPYIDVARVSIDRLSLGPELAVRPATLAVHGSVRLRSIREMTVDLDALRIDGAGRYVLRLKLDPSGVDARVDVREPAGGPLESVVGLGDLGGLSALLTLSGPRQAETLGLRLDAGGLHAAATGRFNLVTHAADVAYSATASAMRPRPDLAWRKIDLRGTWRGTSAAPSVDGRLDVLGLRIGTGTSIGEAQARLSGAGGALSLRGTLSALRIPGPRPDLLSDQPLTFGVRMRLDDPTRTLAFQAAQRLFSLRGTAVTAGAMRAAVDVQIEDIAPFWALAAQDVHGGAAVKVNLRQVAAATQFAVDAKFTGLHGSSAWLRGLGGAASAHVDGSVGGRDIEIAALRVSTPRLTASGAGTAMRHARRSGIGGAGGAGIGALIDSFKATWSLSVPDLSAFGAQLAGRLHASGRLAGPMTGFPAEGFVRIGGVLDAAPLQLAIDWAPDRTGRVQALIRQANWRSVHVTGGFSPGRPAAGARGRLDVAVAALSDFDEILGVRIGGALDASASWSSIGAHSIAAVQAKLAGLTIGGFAGDAQITASGPLGALAVQVAAQAPAVDGAAVRLASTSTLDVPARRLRVSTATLGYRGVEARLAAPTAISFADGVVIGALRLGSGPTTFEADGRLSPALALQARLRGSAAALVDPFFPGLLSEGRLVASAALTGTLAAPRGELRWNATGVRAGGSGAYGLPAFEFRGAATLTGGAARVNAHLDAGKNSALDLNGTVPLSAGGPVDAKVQGSIDLGLASPMLEARAIVASGVLHVAATVTGDARSPHVAGEVRLAGGLLRDYSSGVNLEKIDALLVGDGDSLDIKRLTASAPPGSLSMTGRIGLLEPGIPLDLQLSAKNAQPIATNLLTANVDADVHIGGTALTRIEIGGSVHVNRAVIGIPNAMPPSVAVLDVRRRGETAPAGAARRPLVFGLSLDVVAPRQILVRGRGLDAELGGRLQLSGTTDNPTVSGGFELQRGNFTLAANKLSFTRGRVGFNGEGLRHRIDPSLDFTAQTTAENLTTTLRITGLADAPIFEFTSSPPPSLPQDEIIARLLFGANATQLSALQAAQLGAALATLSGVGGADLNPLDRLQRVLGLDRLTVGTASSTAAGVQRSSSSGASIAAGRYVSSRVYVEAKQTTTGSSQIQVNVDLTKHLTLQTRLGNGAAITQGTTPENDPGSSIGLKYQLEY